MPCRTQHLCLYFRRGGWQSRTQGTGKRRHLHRRRHSPAHSPLLYERNLLTRLPGQRPLHPDASQHPRSHCHQSQTGVVGCGTTWVGRLKQPHQHTTLHTGGATYSYSLKSSGYELLGARTCSPVAGSRNSLGARLLPLKSNMLVSVPAMASKD